MAQTHQPTALIIGGGIAGPVLAFWLARAGFACTVVERAEVQRTTGQQVDIRDAARDIIRQMGLEEAIREHCVVEEGMAFVNAAGKTRAEFLARPDGMSFTCDIEILRAELANVFYDAAKDNATWLFGTRVVALELADGGDGVEATLEGQTVGKRVFDVAIIADGMNSSTRRRVFARDGNPLRDLGQHAAFFTIPLAAHDRPLATVFHAPGGRMVIVRPDVARNRTGAYLTVCEPRSRKSVFDGYERMSIAQQQDLWANMFKGVPGEAARVIAGMRTSDDFYMQSIAQVKAPHWTALGGRVALIGDAAYCPSPISGLGTTCAIIGAYILAGELARAKDTRDWARATSGYERAMRPIADKAQQLIPGAPAIMCPQTKWGIAVLHLVMGFISWSGIANWFQAATMSTLPKFPEYNL